MRECRIAWSPGEARIAVCEDGELIDFALWRPGMPDGYGDLHVVRILTAAPALGGAFVQMAGNATGFLTGTHREGTLVPARVVRSAQNGKGLRLKPVSIMHESDAPARLRRGPTPLEDLASRYPDVDLCCDDPALMALIPAGLRARIERVPRAFDIALSDACDALMTPRADLSHGVTATFSPTPALTAIDLDDPNPDGRRQVDGFTANRDSFGPLAREIRMRNLSGAILIDPAGVPLRKRAALGPFLAQALAPDPMNPKMLGATALGLLEIVRPRGRAPLHERVTSAGGYGLAALRQILHDRTSQRAGGTPELRASPSVIRRLESDPQALGQFALAYGASLQLAMCPDYPDSYWSFTP